MINEFLEIQKTINHYVKEAGIPWRNVWAPAMFANSTTYVAVSPIQSFAQFDGPNPLLKGMGEAKFQQFLSQIRKCVTDHQWIAAQVRPELSIISDSQEPPPMALVVDVQVSSGKIDAFESMIRDDVLPAMKKAGVKDYWVNQTILGGNPNSHTMLVTFDSWAELDKPLPLRGVQYAGSDSGALLFHGRGFILTPESLVPHTGVPRITL
jgi:hypothetical protein